MKFNVALAVLFFCCVAPLFAQTAPEMPPFSGKITGNISDAETKKPLEFAAVSIYNYADSLITGGISDLDGDFELKKLPAGKFYAKIGFVGYITRRVDSLNLSAEMPFKNMGKITLVVDAKEQATVEIKAEKSLLQLGLDKKTFNVEKSALADAENATEVLRGTPGVEVDKDEAVKVRGKVVTVYINGKPTGLSGENQAAILRQIPANTIKSIEIMTNPSAKNAPDGGGGSIINIVMKKNVLTGFTGSVNAGLGTNAQAFEENPTGAWFNKYNGGLSLNYKSRKINIFTNINANDRSSFSNSESYRYNILPDSAYYFNTYNKGNNNYQSLWGRLGTDIYINETNTLSLQVNGSPSRNSSTGVLDYNNFDSDSIMRSIDERRSDMRGLTNNMTYNAIYSIIFPEKDSTGAPNLDKLGMMGENRELVFDLQYIDNRSNNSNGFSNKHFSELRLPLSTLPDSQATRNLSTTGTLQFKADYTHPMPKKEQKLQLGYHFTYQKDKNDFRYENYDAASFSMLNDTTRSNIFEYTQQIHAIYGTFSHKWSEKWSAEYGLRVEQAFVRPYLYNTNTAYPWDYFGVFPTVNVSYEMTETQQFTFEFGRHVGRPWMWDVNPFPDFDDPRVLSYGNPYLRPSYGNNMGINYAIYLGQQSITLGVYGNYTGNESDWITSINNETGVLVSTPKNLSSNYGGGFDLNGNFNLTKWWSINASANGYYNYYNADKVDSSLTYNSLGGYASMYSNMRFKFGLAISFGFHTWYAARDIQGRSIPNVWHWLSVSQTLLKKNLRLSLSINNPFYNNIWQNYTTTPFARGFSVSRWENRVLNLRVSYNFGKTAVKKQRASRLEGRAGGDSGGGQGGGGKGK